MLPACPAVSVAGFDAAPEDVGLATGEGAGGFARFGAASLDVGAGQPASARMATVTKSFITR